MQHKSVIFVVISVLVVALVYSSISAFNVFALVPDEAPPNAECVSFGGNLVTYRCCWTETDPNDPEGIELNWCQYCTRFGCDPKKPASPEPTPSPTGPAAPLQEGVLEQPEQPPLFGQNVPPTGGIEQPPTATTQPAPGGGAGVPTEGGTAEQPTAPQDNQDQGGGLPPIKNQENVPPGGGVAEQPEDDGQEDSSEGSDTAGPLT